MLLGNSVTLLEVEIKSLSKVMMLIIQLLKEWKFRQYIQNGTRPIGTDETEPGNLKMFILIE